MNLHRCKGQVSEMGLIGIIFWKADGAIIDANQTFLTMSQYTQFDLDAGLLNWQEITAIEYRDADSRALTELSKTKKCEPYEKEIIKKDGGRMPVRVGAVFLSDSDEYLTIMLDCSIRKGLEGQIREMEAIGLLAGGVAHDFNNLLTLIVGRTELLAQRVNADPKLQRDAALIRTAAESASALARQLLQSSRSQFTKPGNINLLQVIEDFSDVLRGLVGENIDLAIFGNSDLQPIRADPIQLQQVIMNLVVNSRDAMPNGGNVRIEVSNCDCNSSLERCPQLPKTGSYVVLRVSDSGIGMLDEVKARIFKPFYTTKGRGKGNGLGLSTVYGIVNQCAGHILVESKVNIGTTFTLYFPVAPSQPLVP